MESLPITSPAWTDCPPMFSIKEGSDTNRKKVFGIITKGRIGKTDRIESYLL